MKIIFIDESGYVSDWGKEWDQQPFFTLAAIVVDASDYASDCKDHRDFFKKQKILGYSDNFGRGFELKGSRVIKGSGYWENNSEQREDILKYFFKYPKKDNKTAFLVIVDKKGHSKRYATPYNPYNLSFKYLLERIQGYLEETKDVALMIYDYNSKLASEFVADAAHFAENGSSYQYHSPFYGEYAQGKIKTDRILDVTFADSRFSPGLIIADSFAAMAFQFYKQAKPDHLNSFWRILKKSLYKRDKKLEGWGLKEID